MASDPFLPPLGVGGRLGGQDGFSDFALDFRDRGFSMNDEKGFFVMAHDTARRRALDAVARAPMNWRVTVEPPKRGADINAALHATLTEIAERCDWAGRKWPMEVWKRLLVAAWSRVNADPVMLVPALDGHGVDVVMIRTSTLTQAQVRDLMGFIDAWTAERPEFCEAVPA